MQNTCNMINYSLDIEEEKISELELLNKTQKEKWLKNIEYQWAVGSPSDWTI